jgi:dipeptidyl aminopeptidase/acylaminoacyl peptidase
MKEGAKEEPSSRVQAVCDWFGPANFNTFGPQGGNARRKSPASFPNTDDDDSPEARLLGGRVPDNREKAAAASPVTYATPDDPPFLIMHGDKDPLVPVEQSKELQDVLKSKGIDSTLVVLEGAGHGNGFERTKVGPQIRDFFQRTLKKK